jgi:hypothetical protein
VIYPAPFSGSGSGPAEENFAGFLPENVCLFENLFSLQNTTSFSASSMPNTADFCAIR